MRVPGSALAAESSRFQAVLREFPTLLANCQAYAQAFLGQALQTIACNDVHPLEQRCARWLLVSHDRGEGDSLALGQELLAEMLGVSRSRTAALTRALRQAELIRYRRGIITVLARPGLEAACCECYAIDRERFRRLLPRASD